MAKKPKLSGLLDDVAEKVIKPEPQGIRAYHGSPHDFDRFDLSKIGTGEGAQAYGHGLYFAEGEPTAQFYKNSVSRNADQLKSIASQKGGLSDDAAQLLSYQFSQNNFHGDGFDKWLDAIKSSVNKGWMNGQSKAVAEEIIRNEVAASDAVRMMKSPGHMYEVNIRANPEDFLDWDKPLAQQPAAVQELARTADLSALSPGVKSRVLMEKFRAGNEQPEYPALGHHLHNVLEDYGRKPKPELSQYLLDKGIPGVKYLDAGSRAAGDGSRNYVVFDDSLIDILRKYGMVPAGLLGAAAMAPDAQAAPSRPDWIGPTGAITANPPWLKPDPNERSTLGKLYDAVTADPIGTFKAAGGAIGDAVKGYIGDVRNDPGKGVADAIQLGATAYGGLAPQAFWAATEPTDANAGEDAILADRRRKMMGLLAD